MAHDPLHLMRRRRRHGDFQAHVANAKLVLEAVHIQAIGRDVFPENAGRQLDSFKSFSIDEQDRAASGASRMCTPFEAEVSEDSRFPKLFHGQVLFGALETSCRRSPCSQFPVAVKEFPCRPMSLR